MPYSDDADLLTGNVPLPSYLNSDKFVSDAADEIDSKIGFLYVTPVVVSEVIPEKRPTALLLKRINNHLASGRLLLAAAAAGEDRALHAYGASLVSEANAALESIACGEIKLDADKLNSRPDDLKASPLIGNKDEESNVDAFYDRITNPASPYFPYGRVFR